MKKNLTEISRKLENIKIQMKRTLSSSKLLKHKIINDFRKICKGKRNNKRLSLITTGENNNQECGRAVNASFSCAKSSEFDPSLGHQC